MDLDGTEGKKYVVYANINSQTEDFTFLVTALYHWEKLHPAISLTQPTDPAPLAQKSTKAAKKEAQAKADGAGQAVEEAKAKARAGEAEGGEEKKNDGGGAGQPEAKEEKEAASTLAAVAKLLSEPESVAE